MPAPLVSVILCSHNPRLEYLSRVLSALKGQTLDISKWELVIVDNASDPAIGSRVDLKGHPNAKIEIEPKLGTSHARLRGIQSSVADLLVFVDDDNVLAPNYLECALQIATDYPFLGAWSGQIHPEFEVEPAPEIKPYLGRLCIRSLDRDIWSNLRNLEAAPWGAGMCFRRVVADEYQKSLAREPVRMLFGRFGANLGVLEDVDLALAGTRIGLGTGLFKRMELTHLIPRTRLNLQFLLRLTRDAYASEVLFRKVEGLPLPNPGCRVDRLVRRYKRLFTSRIDCAFEDALRLGEEMGQRLFREHAGANPKLGPVPAEV